MEGCDQITFRSGSSPPVGTVTLQMSAGPAEPPRLHALPGALPSDAEIIARSLTEPEIFATLFDRHAVAVHRYLGRRVGDLADDLVSETFLIGHAGCRRTGAPQRVR